MSKKKFESFEPDPTLLALCLNDKIVVTLKKGAKRITRTVSAMRGGRIVLALRRRNKTLKEADIPLSDIKSWHLAPA